MIDQIILAHGRMENDRELRKIEEKKKGWNDE